MAECEDIHTVTPDNYAAYHAWADKRRAQGWIQKRCPNCRAWAIWTPPIRSVAEGKHKGSTQNF